jgi:hypothetical protein
MHQTSMSFSEQPPAEVDAGANLALIVKVACSSRCDLKGGQIRVVSEDGAVVSTAELSSSGVEGSATTEFVVKAPAAPGPYNWTALFPAQEHHGILHAESSASFSFLVKPHATNMAVWDVPSPVVLESKFKIKIGVKCTAECSLAGREVQVYDQQGACVATGALGDERWSETSGLFWTEVDLTAPGTEGVFEWEARFLKPELEWAHEGSAYRFTFRTAKQPEHVVTVTVSAQETQAPIPQADVILHPYRGRTDSHGVAQLQAPKGEYDLYVTAYGRRMYHSTVRVSDDVSVQAELEIEPVPDTSG